MYKYNKQIGFFIGDKFNDNDIELSESNYNLFKDKIVNVVDNQILVDIEATKEKLRNDINNAIKRMLDNKAKELRYDGIDSISKYLGYDNQFREECEKLAIWNANCWSALILLDNEIDNLSVEDVINQMPNYDEITI